MPAPLISKQALLAKLMDLFRSHGYDGASMAEISAQTGLGKSSLYHYFPGGKEQMAMAVLENLDATLQPVFDALCDQRTPERKLDGLLDAIAVFYDGGKKACLLEKLCASIERERFADSVHGAFEKLLQAFEDLSISAGVARAEARLRAEDAVVRIEGSLIVAAGTGDRSVFSRALQQIRDGLLRPSAASTALGARRRKGRA